MKTITELQRNYDNLVEELNKTEKTPIGYDSEYTRTLVKVNKAKKELSIAIHKELFSNFLSEGVLEFNEDKKTCFAPKYNLFYNYIRRVKILRKSKSGKTADIRIEMLDKNKEFSSADVENVRMSNLEGLITHKVYYHFN